MLPENRGRSACLIVLERRGTLKDPYEFKYSADCLPLEFSGYLGLKEKRIRSLYNL